MRAGASEARRAAALLDTGLPGIDGYELAGRLRAMPELAAMKLSR
jgi:CheY-like chemotaxis protein